MLRFIVSLVAFVPFYLLGMLLAPFLPLFAVMREGPSDNGHGVASPLIGACIHAGTGREPY